MRPMIAKRKNIKPQKWFRHLLISKRTKMSGDFRRSQLLQFPSTKILLKTSKFSKGLYVKAGATKYPNLCFYRNVQTVTYAIVDGSYVPTTTQTHQPDKTKA
ncbi:hypothetical protein NC652_004879 [Populus alba x Populus x berolinensis]|nr:hypothetical protein NC652_004879 [Populus alba x Populus x berolinensis]